MTDKMPDAYARFMQTPVERPKVEAVFPDRLEPIKLTADTLAEFAVKVERAFRGSPPMPYHVIVNSVALTREEVEELHAEWNIGEKNV